MMGGAAQMGGPAQMGGGAPAGFGQQQMGNPMMNNQMGGCGFGMGGGPGAMGGGGPGQMGPGGGFNGYNGY